VGVTVSCPRCGDQVRKPDLMHSAWRCDHCGEVPPFHVAEHINAEIVESVLGQPSPGGDTMPIAALQDLGSEFTPLCERFEHAIHVFRTRPAQAEARVWDVLWELSERTTRSEQRQARRHVALDRACRVIQSRISEPLSLADLATPAGVSPAHLTRLFRAEMGLTATDYLRRCRLERALHLLTRSEVPIKEVACEVGIPDLHAFNKAIRRGYSLSPRELRARGAAPNGLTLRTEAPAAPIVASESPIIQSA